jgi:hypothetical protein
VRTGGACVTSDSQHQTLLSLSHHQCQHFVGVNPWDSPQTTQPYAEKQSLRVTADGVLSVYRTSYLSPCDSPAKSAARSPAPTTAAPDSTVNKGCSPGGMCISSNYTNQLLIHM